MPLQVFWRRAGLGTKLALTNLICVSAILLLLMVAVSWAVLRAMHNNMEHELQAGVTTVGRFLASADEDARKRTQLLSDRLGQSLQGQVALEENAGEWVLTLNGHILNGDLQRVDPFTESTGAPATIFMRQGTDFVRIVSSLKDASGQRVMGTKLDTGHPAYAALQSGNVYMGLAHLFGRQYMTNYTPIKDSHGNVVGATFIGEDFSAALDGLRTAIRSLKIGRDGYYFVLRSDAAGPPGVLAVHPTQEGNNIIDMKDHNGHPFIREMIERKQGTLSYPWTNPGETAPREKIAAFGYYEPWNWVYASSAYVDEFVATTRTMLFMLSGLGLLAVLLLSGLWLGLVQRMIVQPMHRLTDMAQALAEGDLTVRSHHQRQDEIGHMLNAMNQTAEGLTRVVDAVQTRAQGVASASAQIAQGNLELASRTESSASALEQTAAAMEELGSTVAQNADHAQSADSLTRAAQQVVTEGGDAVRQVVSTMQGIDASSKKIADIIGVIDAIAFQTNILALNAAVEAARAGDNGRGFAVVAGEVRLLARRSAEAAKEIKELISRSVSEIHQGNLRAGRAGETMEQAMAEIQKVTNLITDISHASVEQSNGVVQVGEAVTNMDQTTQQNAALVEEMAGAAQSLRQQAQELLESVSVFRTQASTASTASSSHTPAAPAAAAPNRAAPAAATAAPRKAPALAPGQHPKTAQPAAAAAAPALSSASARKNATHSYSAHEDDWESF